VDRLIVADIAPVAYAHTQMAYLRAMRDLDLAGITSRGEADRRLRASIPDFAIRAFLVQSLDVAAATWRLNLKPLEHDMPAIMGFPELDATFEKPTMFLAGGASDYVLPEHRDTIRRYFPTARVVKIPGANHWLHAEKPREFEAAVDAFLART
jgi:pimeloyl-ACP methyl ester carboxylesterase